MDLDVIRDRSALYRATNEGLVENIYPLKVINKDQHSHHYPLKVSCLEGLKLINVISDLQVAEGEGTQCTGESAHRSC